MIKLFICVFMVKFITQTIRIIVTLCIYHEVFNQDQQTYRLCGPLTLSPPQQLFISIILIQLIKFIQPFIKNFIKILYHHQPNGLTLISRSLTFKYLIILIIKMFIIFDQQHRWLYYLHLGLLQAMLFIICILIDLMQHENISQVAQLLLIDTFNILVTMYQLTRTFCPNFAIYWFIGNFFIMMANQIEGHSRNNKQSLYVKYDIYRIFLVFMIYFAIFAVIQAPSYGYKMMYVFLASFYFFRNVLKYVGEGRFNYAVANIVLGFIAIILTSLAYEYYYQ